MLGFLGGRGMPCLAVALWPHWFVTKHGFNAFLFWPTMEVVFRSPVHSFKLQFSYFCVCLLFNIIRAPACILGNDSMIVISINCSFVNSFKKPQLRCTLYSVEGLANGTFFFDDACCWLLAKDRINPENGTAWARRRELLQRFQNQPMLKLKTEAGRVKG